MEYTYLDILAEIKWPLTALIIVVGQYITVRFWVKKR